MHRNVHVACCRMSDEDDNKNTLTILPVVDVVGFDVVVVDDTVVVFAVSVICK